MTKTLQDNADRVTDLVDSLLALFLENRKAIVDARMTSDSVLAGAQAELMPAIKSAQADLNKYFPAGIQMLFQQSTAPPGWKKLTDYNDCALRLTSGDVTTRTNGMAFSACFASGRGLSTAQISMGVNASTLSVDQLAGHSHSVSETSSGSGSDTGDGFSRTDKGKGWWENFIGWRGSNASHGHGCWNTAHGHSVDFHVNFVDVILCEKV